MRRALGLAGASLSPLNLRDVELSDLPGALRGEHRFTAASFDQAHGVSARSKLVQRLASEAYGLDYPAEVQPWGMTTW